MDEDKNGKFRMRRSACRDSNIQVQTVHIRLGEFLLGKGVLNRAEFQVTTT